MDRGTELLPDQGCLDHWRCLGGGPFNPFGGSSTTTKSYAAFVDATYEVNDKLFVTLGGRYGHDAVSDGYLVTNCTTAAYAGPNGETVPFTGNPGTRIPVDMLKNDSFTPRVVLRYKPARNRASTPRSRAATRPASSTSAAIRQRLGASSIRSENAGRSLTNNRRGGWQRGSAIGVGEVDIDLLLTMPTTNETAWVQVKSKATQAVVDDDFGRFERDGSCQHFYFVCHSGPASLSVLERAGVHLWTGPTLARQG